MVVIGEDMKLRDDVFYDVDDWLLETNPEALVDSETHYLVMQLKNARRALVDKLEENKDDIL